MNTEPQNPSNPKYWEGKLVLIPNSIMGYNWTDLEIKPGSDREDNGNPFSRDFRDEDEFNQWKKRVSEKPVLIVNVEVDVDGTAEYSYYALKFYDGVETVCGMHINYESGWSRVDWDDDIKREFDKWDLWQEGFLKREIYDKKS